MMLEVHYRAMIFFQALLSTQERKQYILYKPILYRKLNIRYFCHENIQYQMKNIASLKIHLNYRIY